MPPRRRCAQNTLDTAVRASDSQAFEYFPKPFDLDELTKAVAQAAARRPSPGPRSDPAEDMPFIGRSQAMQGVYRMISRVVRNDLTVLVTGESGTGKVSAGSAGGTTLRSTSGSSPLRTAIWRR